MVGVCIGDFFTGMARDKIKTLIIKNSLYLCSAVIDPSVQPGSIGYMGINAMPRARVLSFSTKEKLQHSGQRVHELRRSTIYAALNGPTPTTTHPSSVKQARRPFHHHHHNI